MLHHRELYHQILLNKSQLGEQKPDVSTVLLDLHKLLENISAFLSLLELFGLGVASPDDIVRQPSQLGVRGRGCCCCSAATCPGCLGELAVC